MKKPQTKGAQWFPPMERDGDVTLGSGDRQTIEVTCV